MSDREARWLGIRVKGQIRLVMASDEGAFKPGDEVSCELDGTTVHGLVIARGIVLPPDAEVLIATNPALFPSAQDVGVSTTHQQYLDSWRSRFHPGTRVHIAGIAGTIIQIPYKSGDIVIRLDDGTEQLIRDDHVDQINLLNP